MQVTDEMVERVARIMADDLKEIGLTAESPVASANGTVSPLWTTYTALARRALTAALSDQERAVEVKGLTWVEGWGGSLDDIPEWRAKTPWGSLSASVAGCRDAGGNRFEHHRDVPADLKERLITEATAHYEAKVCSALVDVPVEPVAYLRLENQTDTEGEIYTGLQLSDASDERAFPVYTRPPHREGEDSAEVIEEGAKILAKWIGYAWDGLSDRDISAEYKDWAYNGIGALGMQGGKPALRKVAASILALAATRSGSATGHSGGGE